MLWRRQTYWKGLMAQNGLMITTVDLPDELVHRTRRLAARRGLTFTEVLIEALEDLLPDRASWSKSPGWESLFGAFAGSPELTVLQKTLDDEFSSVDLKAWS